MWSADCFRQGTRHLSPPLPRTLPRGQCGAETAVKRGPVSLNYFKYILRLNKVQKPKLQRASPGVS